ncbi:MAG: NAD(P)/FAD-dependent oxidoreductase [Lachnospiraceae bacterium]
MLRLHQVKIEILPLLSEKEKEANQKLQLEKKIRNILGLTRENPLQWSIVKRSLDARKKPQLFYSYVIDAEVPTAQEEKLLKRAKHKQVERVIPKPYCFPEEMKERKTRPIIVGTGPAGLFCGYFLAKYGYRPILLERGKAVEERKKDVEDFWRTGRLNPESNVQFGEGGAGTFSDGKLNTLVKEKYGRNREVLSILVKHGAPEQILYDSKPHIGTDILRDVVKNMRRQISDWGGEVYFQTKMTELIIQKGEITGVQLSTGETLHSDAVVLAIGHSARDTFEMCCQKQIPMEAKAFAVGLRVEHPQKMIDHRQYGESCMGCLPAAAYKLAVKSDEGRGVYSFCMCPGGYVVNASSEPGMLAVNGMSYSGRDGSNANSAILVSVTPEDYSGEGPLAGMEFQRRLEKRAFELGQGKIPVQYYKDFKQQLQEASRHQGNIPEGFKPMFKGEYSFSDVSQILPKELNLAFIQGMERFHRMIPGFGDDYALISGVESRTSSPVRIHRDETGQSAVRGLYPCGEGAGYAGGITSAAMDGIYIAEMIAKG